MSGLIGCGLFVVMVYGVVVLIAATMLSEE